MAQLIQLRQRLKAVETIKKITHAMRLISMSAHSRLRTKEQSLADYVTTSQNLFDQAQHAAPGWRNPLENSIHANAPQLIILIGSQRGLCGTFNSGLFHYFNKTIASLGEHKRFKLIIIGKQAIGHIKPSHFYTIEKTFSELSPATINTITHELVEHIKQTPYSHVSVISNELKGFFTQKPHTTHIIPMKPIEQTKTASPIEYHWEQDPSTLCDLLLYQLITTHIYTLIFQSLLAEQAARFISMDSATRNANNLLETTKLQYNKLRQTIITKELTELTSSM